MYNKNKHWQKDKPTEGQTYRQKHRQRSDKQTETELEKRRGTRVFKHLKKKKNPI